MPSQTFNSFSSTNEQHVWTHSYLQLRLHTFTTDWWLHWSQRVAPPLTYEVVGASQVVVPHRHLQRLVAELRQRDLVEELLWIRNMQRLRCWAEDQCTGIPGGACLTSLNSGLRVFFITAVLCLDFFCRSGFRYLTGQVQGAGPVETSGANEGREQTSTITDHVINQIINNIINNTFWLYTHSLIHCASRPLCILSPLWHHQW